MKSKFSTFNDGVLWICAPEEAISDFGAVKNTAKKTDLKKIQKLNYHEQSKRDQDLVFAESQGRTLNLKVKCPLWPKIDTLQQVLIEKTLYSIINLDEDRGKHVMYIYLEEVRKL